MFLIKELSHSEKLLLLHFLVTGLLEESGLAPLNEGNEGKLENQGLHTSFAVAALARALAEEKAATQG